MPLKAVFDALIRTRNLAADDALAAAMAEAEPEAIDAIMRAALERNQPAGLAGLVAWYHRMSKEQQQVVHGCVDRLCGVMRDCCSMDEVQARLNVVTIVSESRRYRLAYLLSSLLRDRSPRVRKAAATALQSLVDRFLTEMTAFNRDWGEEPPDADCLHRKQAALQEKLLDRCQLADAVGAALESFDKHLHPPVVETAMWLVDELGERFWSILRLAGGHARRAALDIIQGTLTPRLVPFIIEGLAYDEFRPTIVRALSGNLPEATITEWIRQSWRLRAEPLSRSLRLVKQWPRLTESFTCAEKWVPEDQCGAVRLLAHTHLPAETKVGLLRKLLLRGSPEGRRAATWGLCETRCAASSMVLRAVVEGSDPQLAAIARRELKRRARLEASEPPKGLLSEDNPFVVEMERYWSEFESLSPGEQADRGLAVLSRPEAVHAFARTKLCGQSVTAKIKALRILAVTGCGPAVEQTVYTLAHDTDPVVRSAAMTVLGQIRTPASELLLRSALRDPDSRVQANAIESLNLIASAATEPLVHEKLQDENNRTRANAVKALLKLRVREAAESLCAMLRSPDVEQRRSGLWVVGQLRLTPLIHRIAELAQSDPDPQIRRRAREVLDGLGPEPGPADEDLMHEEVLRSAR